MIHISAENFLDLRYLASGVFYPIDSFMSYDEYVCVVKDMRLLNKEIFSLPISLEVEHLNYNIGSKQDLYYDDTLVGFISISDKFKIKKEHIFELYQSKDEKHPGIIKENLKSPYRVAGSIEIKEEFLKVSLYKNFLQDYFKKINKNVKTIAGFQTRNPIHKAHEHLQRVALELCDALFINPLVGWKKEGDFSENAVMKAYEFMLEEFYPKNRVVLRGLQTAMRYAGPKEAVFHAILRRNIGCSHFIVGRDHAGVGTYYGNYEAQDLAKAVEKDLGISILALKEPYYCKKCNELVSEKTCSHKENEKIYISGTKIRQALKNDELPSEFMMRKEISNVILSLGKDNIFIKEN